MAETNRNEPTAGEELMSTLKDANFKVKVFKGLAAGLNQKSLAGMAAKNIFEFPVFVSKSVPLEYAEATNALLEQLYASWVQVAISNDPFIDKTVLARNGPLAKFKTDTSEYLEYVDIDYMRDSCRNVIYNPDNGTECIFEMLSITDTEAKVINEALEYEPLSEFDHYFQEETSDQERNQRMSGPFTADDLRHTSITSTSGTEKSESTRNSTTSGSSTTAGTQTTTDNGSGGGQTRNGNGSGGTKVTTSANATSDSSQSHDDSNSTAKKKTMSSTTDNPSNYDVAHANLSINKMQEELDNIIAKRQELEIELEKYRERLERGDEIDKSRLDELNERIDQLRREAETYSYHFKVDEHGDVVIDKSRPIKIDGVPTDLSPEEKIIHERIKLIMDTRLSGVKYQQAVNDLMRDETRFRMERERHAKDMMTRAPQLMDESKIQKLNTMKPFMMIVQLRVEDNILERDPSGRSSGPLKVKYTEPVEYAIGVKTYSRLIDPDILPEVAEYPLREMNSYLRKVKWKAKEIKFVDYMFKTKAKKQTAVDSRDPKRKWYRRLYELAHKTGDSLVSNKISGNSSSGLIPNATIIISQSDVDNIKAQKNIDLLRGSIAKKFCKELFLMALVVIDFDVESIKILQPDGHSEYEVHHLAAVKKQLAALDSSSDKARDMFKLLGR